MPRPYLFKPSLSLDTVAAAFSGNSSAAKLA
jgi:hypothetical protein